MARSGVVSTALMQKRRHKSLYPESSWAPMAASSSPKNLPLILERGQGALRPRLADRRPERKTAFVEFEILFTSDRFTHGCGEKFFSSLVALRVRVENITLFHSAFLGIVARERGLDALPGAAREKFILPVPGLGQRGEQVGDGV